MSYPGYYSEGYYSDDQIWAAVQRRMQDDSRYRNDLQGAMAQRSRKLLYGLIRAAVLTVLGFDIAGIVMDATSWLSDITSQLSDFFGF